MKEKKTTLNHPRKNKLIITKLGANANNYNSSCKFPWYKAKAAELFSEKKR